MPPPTQIEEAAPLTRADFLIIIDLGKVDEKAYTAASAATSPVGRSNSRVIGLRPAFNTQQGKT